MKQITVIVRVFIQSLLVATFIIFAVFFGMRMMDYWEMPDGEAQPGTLAKQAWGDTTGYLTNLFEGDLGTATLVYGEEEVSNVLWEWFKNSMGLIAISLTLATALGIFMGLTASLAKSQLQTYLVLFLTMLGLSAPVFFVAVLLQTLGIRYTVTFGSRLVSMGGFAWDFEHLLMPVLALMARPLAQITRVTYISMQEILKEDYIRTAYSKGLRQERVIWVHAFRNFILHC
jgi:peptide/nickel transport system permease protein